MCPLKLNFLTLLVQCIFGKFTVLIQFWYLLVFVREQEISVEGHTIHFSFNFFLCFQAQRRISNSGEQISCPS